MDGEGDPATQFVLWRSSGGAFLGNPTIAHRRQTFVQEDCCVKLRAVATTACIFTIASGDAHLYTNEPPGWRRGKRARKYLRG
jgi:hypothetical protein